MKKLANKLPQITHICVMATLLIFFLTYPHLTLTFSLFSVALGFASLVPLITLLMINIKRDIADLLYLVLFSGLIFLFFMSGQSFALLLLGSRFWLGLLLLLAFALTYALYFALLFFTLQERKKMVKKEDEPKDKTKQLARVAQVARLKTRMSTFSFYIVAATILGVLFFGVALFSESFTIPLGGDYTQQQIPFYTNGYDDWWRFLKTGEFPLWDSNTFLGASNIGSNSFYYSMNPFFLPILLFPRELIPQGLAVLMIGKFVLASLTMRAFLKYMGVNETNARLFSLVYAFGGWNAYYLWFNHFMEVAVIFPLVFLGIEKTLQEKKITTLIVGLALLGFANYFFLVTTGIIGVLYAIYRYFVLLPTIKRWDKLTVMGLGVLGFALGILLSSVVLFPSLTIALNSDRVTNATYLENLKLAFTTQEYKEVWTIISKWEYQSATYDHKKWYPLISFYFPVLSDRSSPLLNTSSYDNTISSIYAFSAVIFLFIPTLFLNLKKKKVYHLLPLAFFLFALFTPFFYNFLHGFSKEYGRWQLIVSFLFITYVAQNIEEVKKLPSFVFDLSFIINVVLMGITTWAAFSFENKNGFSYMYEREYVIYYAFFMFFLTYLYYRHKRQSTNEEYFRFGVLAFEIVVMGTITMIGHGFISYKGSVSGGLQSYRDDMAAINKIKASDETYYRIYNTRAYRGNDNLPMRENYNGLSTFHSLYNFELMTFNEWSRINYNRDGWSLGIHERHVFLDDFLNVKYYVIDDNSHAIRWSDGTKTRAPYHNVPNTFSYQERLSTTARAVYQKEESFTVGFGVDDVVSYETMVDDELYDVIKARGQYASAEIEELYLNAALLNYEDAESVRTLYPNLATNTYDTMMKNQAIKYYGHSSQVKRVLYSCPITRYPYEGRASNPHAPLPTAEYLQTICTVMPEMPVTIDGSKHAIEYTLRNGANFLDEAGSMLFNLPFAQYNSGLTKYSYNYNIFLYDENDELITFDNHTFPASASRYWKIMRGLHSPTKVKKITLVPIGEQNSPTDTGIYIYSQTLINQIRAKSLANALENVNVSQNKITFSTNYADHKYIVTTMPYDKGWQAALSSGERLPIYKTQGGFIGLVSAKGASNYVLSFVPEYFTFGLLLSGSSLFVTIMISGLPLLLKIIKTKKRAQLASGNNKEEIKNAN